MRSAVLLMSCNWLGGHAASDHAKNPGNC